eukprot:gene22604-biopygen22250
MARAFSVPQGGGGAEGGSRRTAAAHGIDSGVPPPSRGRAARAPFVCRRNGTTEGGMGKDPWRFNFSQDLIQEGTEDAAPHQAPPPSAGLPAAPPPPAREVSPARWGARLSAQKRQNRQITGRVPVQVGVVPKKCTCARCSLCTLQTCALQGEQTWNSKVPP